MRTEDKRGNLSFFLGDKTRQDPPEWAPNMDAVLATIRFALQSKRLEDTKDTVGSN